MAVFAGVLAQALLFEVDPREPLALALPALVLAATGLVACLLPARRAVSVDPVNALRSD